MVLGNTSAAFFMAMEAKENLFLMLKLVTRIGDESQKPQQVMILGEKVTLRPVRMSIRSPQDEVSGGLDLVNILKSSTQGNQLGITLDYPVDKLLILNWLHHLKTVKKSQSITRRSPKRKNETSVISTYTVFFR